MRKRILKREKINEEDGELNQVVISENGLNWLFGESDDEEFKGFENKVGDVSVPRKEARVLIERLVTFQDKDVEPVTIDDELQVFKRMMMVFDKKVLKFKNGSWWIGG